MPTVAEVHVDAVLTDFALGYVNNDFISNMLFPTVVVGKQSDKYFTVDQYKEALRQQDDRRAPGAESAEVDWSNTTATYFCEDHALKHRIPDEERANADQVLQEDLDGTQIVVDKILLNKEIALVSALESNLASEGTNLLTLTHEWDDDTNGDPIANIETARGYVIENSHGRVPNVLVIPWATYRGMKDHPDILGRIQGGATTTNPAMVTPEMLAQLFDVERVLIPKSFKNTSAPGAAASTSEVWGENDVILAYVPPVMGRRVQALGATFTWNVNGAGSQGYVVQKYRDPDPDRASDMVKVSYYYDQKVVDSNCACRIANTVS